jgi:hypothetical protein
MIPLHRHNQYQGRNSFLHSRIFLQWRSKYLLEEYQGKEQHMPSLHTPQD